jgi:hypothetical protein
MRHLLEEISSAGIGREESLADDGLTPEERTQLRELCMLILISEFLETSGEFNHKDPNNPESEKSWAGLSEEMETRSDTWPATKPSAGTSKID